MSLRRAPPAAVRAVFDTGRPAVPGVRRGGELLCCERTARRFARDTLIVGELASVLNQS